ELTTTIIHKRRINLANTNLQLTSVTIPQTPHFDEETVIQTLSPITVYSTLQTPTGEGKPTTTTPRSGSSQNSCA
ncbi:MAG: hypothetical protein ACTSP1_18985, partial [Candidatus Freyarchaeota archaeon]